MYIIRDKAGYYCGCRRPTRDRIIDFWSPCRDDAADFHFLEAASRIAERLQQGPQGKEIRVLRTRN